MENYVPIHHHREESRRGSRFLFVCFSKFSLISLNHHAEPHQELIMLAVFSINEQEIMISDPCVSHEWGITPGISFFMDLNNEDELDALSKSLESGGKIHFACPLMIMVFQSGSHGLKISLE